MKRSTVVLLFLSLSFLIVFIMAGLFFFIRPVSIKSQKISEAKNYLSSKDTDINITKNNWIKDLASIERREESYFYPVLEIYINLD